MNATTTPRPAAPQAPVGAGGRTPGLRERKKRLMREQLSDVAARMFLERGFDGVRVAEVAEACGVSEKTVFNYFPTKEALLFDRLEATADALRTSLADPALAPVDGMLQVLERERSGVLAALTAAPDPGQAVGRYLRFGDLIRGTPSLRAHQSEVVNQFAELAAQVLAARTGTDATDPEPKIAATALLGLWRLQFDALRTHLGSDLPAADAVAATREDVRRAARLIERGLGTLPVSRDA